MPEAVKRERLERVTERQRLITADRYDAMVGTLSEAIVDSADAGPRDPGGAPRAGARARLACQADDIDGITFLDRSDLPGGSIVEVCVDGVVEDYDFVATVRRVISVPSPATVATRRPMLPIATMASTVGSFGR